MTSEEVVNAKSARVAEIDYLRGIAIIGIVILHSLTSIAYDSYSSLTSTVLFITIVVGFAVPFFFAISGYVIYYNYKGKFDIVRFYKKRLWTIVPAYLLFSLIYYLYNNSTYTLNGFVGDLVTFKASGHLWFVAAIIAFYVLYPLILWLFNRILKGNFLLLIILSGIIQISYYLTLRDALPSSIAGASSFLGYILYFSLGMYLASKPKFIDLINSRNLIYSSIMIVIGSSIFMTWAFYQLGDYNEWGRVRELVNPFLVFASLLVFLHVSRRVMESRKIGPEMLKAFGKCSYGIYLVHILVISIIINELTYVFSIHDALLYIILIPSAMAISYIIIDLMSRVSILNRIFSLKR